MKIAVDWDHTCVDRDGNWLPGALDGLRWLRRNGHHIRIHSCRANYAAGHDEIMGRLAEHKIWARVYPKPDADVYLDDRALRFEGSWPDVLKQLRSVARAA